MAVRDDLLPGVPTRHVFIVFFGTLGPMMAVILYLVLSGVEYPSPHALQWVTSHVVKDYVLTAMLAAGIYFLAVRWMAIPWTSLGFRACSIDWLVRALLLSFLLMGLKLLADVAWHAAGAASILLQPALADSTVIFGESKILCVLLLISITVLVPVVQEIFLRGLFFAWLRRNLDFFLAAIANSLIFGAFHFESVRYGQALVFNITAAYLYEHSRSLWPPIVLHVAIGVIYLALLSRP